MDNESVRPQRSPWFYALLGCGGLAGLLCIGSAVFLFFVGKQMKGMSEGINDPHEREKNALAQLGALPEGYTVVASVSVFGVAKTTILTDQPLLPDGGITGGGRTFNYVRLVANERNQETRAFIEGTSPEAADGAAQTGLHLDRRSVIKRGQLQVDGQRIQFLVARAAPPNGAEPVKSLVSLVLFSCADDALRVGVWAQPDPAPEQPMEAIDLKHTVGDEAELARFLKPMHPCDR